MNGKGKKGSQNAELGLLAAKKGGSPVSTASWLHSSLHFPSFPFFLPQNAARGWLKPCRGLDVPICLPSHRGLLLVRALIGLTYQHGRVKILAWQPLSPPRYSSVSPSLPFSGFIGVLGLCTGGSAQRGICRWKAFGKCNHLLLKVKVWKPGGLCKGGRRQEQEWGPLWERSQIFKQAIRMG